MPFVTDNADVLNSTLQQLGRFKFTDLSPVLQAYPIAQRVLRKTEMKVHEGGDYIEGTINTTDNQSAQSITPGQVRTININSGTIKWRVDWRHLEMYYALVSQYLDMNRGEQRILDYASLQRLRAMQSWVAKFETLAWSVPADSSSADFNGIPYSVVQSTNNTPGFNGQHPSGHSAVQNVDATTAANAGWRNYTFEFDAITKADFLPKFRTMLRKTNWRPAFEDATRKPTLPRFQWYTGEQNINDFETLGEAQNDNLGRDIDSMQDSVSLRRIKAVYTPEIDNNATLASLRPFYAIDWENLKFEVLAGQWNKKTEIKELPYQPDVAVVYTDFTFNLCNHNRRTHGVATLSA